MFLPGDTTVKYTGNQCFHTKSLGYPLQNKFGLFFSAFCLDSQTVLTSSLLLDIDYIRVVTPKYGK